MASERVEVLRGWSVARQTGGGASGTQRGPAVEQDRLTATALLGGCVVGVGGWV